MFDLPAERQTVRISQTVKEAIAKLKGTDMGEMRLKQENNCILGNEQRQNLPNQLPDWQVVMRNDMEYLQRIFSFDSYQEALDFTYQLGGLAEDAGRYPDLLTIRQKVTVSWHTQGMEAVTGNDVILAKQTNKLFAQR